MGVFLQSKGWNPGPIGQVMTLGGVAGTLVGIPAGAFIDATKSKRLCIALAAALTMLASGLIFISSATGW